MENGDGETTNIIRPKSGFNVNYIKPCTEEGKKTANIQFLLEGHIDIKRVSEILRKSKQPCFENIKTLENIGIVKFDFNKRSGTFFANGKLIIRKVKNEMDVLKLAEMFSNLIKHSIRNKLDEK